MKTKKSNWKQSREYKRILEILDDYWLSQPEEEKVVIEMYFKHQNGEEQHKTILWCWTTRWKWCIVQLEPKNGKIGLGQGKYQIVYDIAGDYFRIFDITIKSKNYKFGKPLGLEKEELFNVTEGGKTRGRSKNEVNFVSHFDNTDTRR